MPKPKGVATRAPELRALHPRLLVRAQPVGSSESAAPASNASLAICEQEVAETGVSEGVAPRPMVGGDEGERAGP